MPALLGALEALLRAGDDLPTDSATLRYDVVNIGRELLDRVADARYEALAASMDGPSSAAVAAADGVVEVQEDADALLCTDAAFALSSWVAAASAMGQEDGLAAFYNRMARSQVTTWLPACHDAAEFAGGVCSIHTDDTTKPPLEDYANKAWGGLAKHYYAGRVRCYSAEWKRVESSATAINVTAYHACIDTLARDFQYDSDESKFPICHAPVGDTLVIAAALLEKYRGEILAATPGALVI